MSIYDPKANKIYLNPKELMQVAKEILGHLEGIGLSDCNKLTRVELDINNEETETVLTMGDKIIKFPLKVHAVK